MRFFCIGVVYMNRFFREFLMKTVGYLEPVDFFLGGGWFGLSGPSMSNSICWLSVNRTGVIHVPYICTLYVHT